MFPRLNITQYLGLTIIIFAVLYKLYTQLSRHLCKSKVCLIGRTVLITGANTGIGYETAIECAKRGARVIVACRDVQKGSAAVQNIIKLTKNDNVLLKLLDLSSVSSVKKCAKDILENEKRLDILINNAGAIGLENKMTADGFQLEWQVNYFGPVLLTLMLVDLLKQSSPSRIINVSSIVAKRSNLSVKTFNSYESYFYVYSNSKLGNIIFTQELANRLKSFNVSVFSLHPGSVSTEILTQRIGISWLRAFLNYMMNIFLLNPEEGAQTTLHTALEQGVEHLTGRYFANCRVQEDFKTTKDPALGKYIWDETLRLLKFDVNGIL